VPERGPDAATDVGTPDGAVYGSAPRSTPIVVLGEMASVATLCEQRCRADPLREFVAVKLAGSWWRVAYAEFLTLVAAARGGLAGLGVAAGDAVAIVSAPRFEWAVACYAIAGLGAASVSIAPARSEDEWRAIVADSGARVVLGSTEAITASLARLCRDVPTLAHVVGLETGASSWRALLEAGRRRPAPIVLPARTATASLCYPAGQTTGAAITQDAMLAAASAVQARLELGAEDCVLVLAGGAEVFEEVELHAVFAAGCPFAIADGADVAADVSEIDPTVVFAATETLDRLQDIVEQRLGRRSSPVRRLLRREIAVAARRSRGEPVGWLDARIAGLAHRLLPQAVRRPFGGRLRFAVKSARALSKPVQDMLDAAGVAVCRVDREARS
jgi:long-chain acyl-CoA synthetase